MSDLTKLEDPPEERRNLVKGDYTFIDEVFDLYLRHEVTAVGIQPQKTSIGLQVLMRDSDIQASDYESKLGGWACKFHRLLSGLVRTRIKYFELRPYSYAPSS